MSDIDRNGDGRVRIWTAIDSTIRNELGETLKSKVFKAGAVLLGAVAIVTGTVSASYANSGGGQARVEGSIAAVGAAAMGQRSHSTAPDAAIDGPEPQPLAERRKVRVAVSKLTVFAPLFVADAMGEFERENIDLEIVDVAPQERLPLLAQGDVDVAYSAFEAGVYNLIADDFEIRWTFPGQGYDSVATSQGFWVNTDTIPDGHLQPGDLREIAITLPQGNASIAGWYIWEWARRQDPTLELTELNYNVMIPADAAIALMNGAIDLGFLVSPGTEQVADSNCACQFVDTEIPLEPSGGYMFGPSLFADRELGDAWVRAMTRATRTYLQGDYLRDPQVVSALADAIGAPEEVIAAGAIMIFDPEVPLIANNLGAQDYYRALGLLTYDENLTEADAFDHSFLDAMG